MCACLVHSLFSAACMSAQLSFGMPLHRILYATCWIVRGCICEMYSIHDYMCVFRLYVIFLDRQFSNELASLATHPRSELFSPAYTILIYSIICFSYIYDVIVILA
jgi:hypothetical protein